MIIAQLTDTHVKAGGRLAYGRSDTVAALTLAVDHLNNLNPRVDAVIVSGDLVDSAKAEDYVTLRPLLDRLSMPWFAVPGNHDGREAFRQCFSDYDWMPAQGFIQFVIDSFPVRLIGLDSLVEGRPHGALCEARLAWLDDCLSQNQDKPVLVFLHHPPFRTGIHHMDVQRLLDAEPFATVIECHPQVRHIACGHVHRAIQSRFAGVVATIAPSPAHAVRLDLSLDAVPQFDFEPPAVRLFYWHEEERTLVTHLSFIGAFDGPYPFFDAAGAPIDT